jgi:hypothetical protein
MNFGGTQSLYSSYIDHPRTASRVRTTGAAKRQKFCPREGAVRAGDRTTEKLLRKASLSASLLGMGRGFLEDTPPPPVPAWKPGERQGGKEVGGRTAPLAKGSLLTCIGASAEN